MGSVRVSEPRNVPSRADGQAGTISRESTPSCVRDIRRGWIGHLLSDGARGATLAIVAAACSPSAKHPPLEGDCFPTSEAGCSITVSAGGENGTREGGIAGACQVTSSQSQCDQCVYGSCCDDILSCFSTTTCTNLYNCSQGCDGASSCIGLCETQYPSASIQLEIIESCVANQCPVCGELGIGDSCSNGASCVSGLTCRNSSCTKACSGTPDCVGLGMNGGNSVTGLANACVPTFAGVFCEPGCVTDSDCATFTGTFCESTTALDGTTVSICTLLPDGG